MCVCESGDHQQALRRSLASEEDFISTSPFYNASFLGTTRLIPPPLAILSSCHLVIFTIILDNPQKGMRAHDNSQSGSRPCLRLPRQARNYCTVVASPSAPPSMVFTLITYATVCMYVATGLQARSRGPPTIKVRGVVQPPSGPRAGVPKTDGWK